ncbi:MAG: S-layer homology domain-containing protein [Solirubrobacterales bacterium]
MRKMMSIVIMVALILGITGVAFAKGPKGDPPGQANKGPAQEEFAPQAPPTPPTDLPPIAKEKGPKKDRVVSQDVYGMPQPPVLKEKPKPPKKPDKKGIVASVYNNVYGPPEEPMVIPNVNPNKPVPKLDGLIVLMQAAKLSPPAGAITSKDYKKIPAEKRKWVKLALTKGLMTQGDLKKFNPNQPLKRGEAELIMKKLGLKLAAPAPEPTVPTTVYDAAYAVPAPKPVPTVSNTVYDSVYGPAPTPVPAPAPAPAPVKKPKNPNSPLTWGELKAMLGLGKPVPTPVPEPTPTPEPTPAPVPATAPATGT